MGRFVREPFSELATTEIPLWYALTVAPKHERISASFLADKGIEQFSPFYTHQLATIRGDNGKKRIKLVEKPLFPRYIFARFAYSTRAEVLETCGVKEILKFGPVPQSIPPGEIAALQAAVAAGLDLTPVPYDPKVGDLVEIMQGAMAGYKGRVEHFKGEDRLILSVEMLNRSVAVNIHRDWVDRAA